MRAARAGSAKHWARLPLTCNVSAPPLRVSARWLRAKRTSVPEAAPFESLKLTVTSLAALK